jgi:phosphoribosylformylglycinamidine cyclo-ligase
MDGVGTKTVVAHQTGMWDGIGKDIVNHCANDLVCQGGRPLFFLDYMASSSLNPEIAETLVRSMSEACKDLDCVLIGGETAEMPTVYHEGAHDVVGTMVGFADRERMFRSEDIVEGDVCIALPSNGLHTNGYTLARKVFGNDNLIEQNKILGCSIAEALLKPHTCYAPLVLKLHEQIGIKAVAHITGGGIQGNLKRILPDGLGASIEKSSIEVLPIFEMMQERGGINDDDMYEAFNMGVGMILVVAANKEKDIRAGAEGSSVIGKISSVSGVLMQ